MLLNYQEILEDHQSCYYLPIMLLNLEVLENVVQNLINYHLKLNFEGLQILLNF